MSLYSKCRTVVQKILLKRYWRLKNSHNSTWLGPNASPNFERFVRSGGVKVGKATYGQLNINYTGNEKERLVIGKYCSIATTCLFILGGEHDYRCISTYPFVSKIGKYPTEVLTKGPIVLEDEVWIGDMAIIMSGVRLGRGAVVAAGSVVTKSVPPFAVVGGNPARIIRYRFPKEVSGKLADIRFDIDRVDDDTKDILTTHVTRYNVDELLEKLKKRGFVRKDDGK